jgi:hypothetical protein
VKPAINLAYKCHTQRQNSNFSPCSAPRGAENLDFDTLTHAQRPSDVNNVNSIYFLAIPRRSRSTRLTHKSSPSSHPLESCRAKSDGCDRRGRKSRTHVGLLPLIAVDHRDELFPSNQCLKFLDAEDSRAIPSSSEKPFASPSR